MKTKIRASPTKTKPSLSTFLKDKNGAASLRELVILVCLISITTAWIGEQFFLKKVPEYIFYAFTGLVGAGCFGYSIEKKSST